MDTLVPTIVALFRTVHAQIREEVRDLDAAALHWRPGPDTSSIATLVIHTLGSEGDVLRAVRGLPSDRDRDAEFVPGGETAADLLRRLDAADALLDEVGAGISIADLEAMRPRGDRPPQTGLNWLLGNFGHAREHLAQLQLTKQLYQQQKQEERA